MFLHPGDSHTHSLQILNALYEYDDFMESIATVVDLGCGTGEDLEWWATRHTRDEIPIPLNIRCVGVDIAEQLLIAKKYPNITYQKTNFEGTIYPPKEKFDILWSHNSFQYCINPLQTLVNWKNIASENGMLIISLPQTTNFKQKEQDIYLKSGCYYNHTLVSLIYMLAVTGWDCTGGFFQRTITDPWINIIVYNSKVTEMDPATTTWYDLVEKKALPLSAEKSVMAHGYLRQQDLILPWIDKSLNLIGKQ